MTWEDWVHVVFGVILIAIGLAFLLSPGFGTFAYKSSWQGIRNNVEETGGREMSAGRCQVLLLAREHRIRRVGDLLLNHGAVTCNRSRTHP